MIRPFALIIEDDPKLGAVFQIALQKAGFDTDLDPDGNLFTQKLAERLPALIILDVHMPFASGVDILRQLRTNEHWMHIPVIVTTADLQRAKSLQGKAEYVLLKPVSVSQLVSVATQFLSKS
jgi:two-component system phosphate regulon response regulator PhoB